MSRVTNIIFAFSIIEEGGDDSGEFILFKEINKWLKKEGYGELKSIDDCAGGSKRLEAPIFAAAFNFFLFDEFKEFVSSLNWNEPDAVQIFVKEQEDDEFSIVGI